LESADEYFLGMFGGNAWREYLDRVFAKSKGFPTNRTVYIPLQ
jgi:hypothetical protein